MAAPTRPLGSTQPVSDAAGSPPLPAMIRRPDGPAQAPELRNTHPLSPAAVAPLDMLRAV